MSVIELSLSKSPKKANKFSKFRRHTRPIEGQTPAKNNVISNSRNQIRLNQTQSYGDSTSERKCKKIENILMSEIPFSLLPNKEKQRIIDNKNNESKIEEQAAQNNSEFDEEDGNEFANLFKNLKNSGVPMSFNQEVLHCFYTNKDQNDFDKESFESSLKRLVIKERSKVDSSIILPNLNKNKSALNNDITNFNISSHPYESIQIQKSERCSSFDASVKTPLERLPRSRFSGKYFPKLNQQSKPQSPNKVFLNRSRFQNGSKREATNSFKLELISTADIERKISNGETEGSVTVSSQNSNSPKKKKTSEDIEKQAEEAYLRMERVLSQCKEICNKEKYFKCNKLEFCKKLKHERLRRRLITMKD